MKFEYLPDAITLAAHGDLAESRRPPMPIASLLSLFPIFAVAVASAVVLGAKWRLGGALLPDSGMTVAAGCSGLLTLALRRLIGAMLKRAASILVSTLATCVTVCPVLCAISSELLEHPIVHDKSCAFWCDPRHYGWTYSLAVGPALCGVAALLVAYAIARCMRALGMRNLRRMIAGLGACAFFGAALLGTAGLVASVRRANPAWPNYVSGLPVVADLPSPQEQGAQHSPWTSEEETPRRYRARAGEMWIFVFKYAPQWTGVTLSRDGAASGRPSHGGLRVGADSRLVIRADRPRHVLYVEDLAASRGREGWFAATRLAFDDRTLERIQITPMDFVHESGPPYSWVATTFAGLAAALSAVFVRSRSMRRLSRRDAWRPAIANGAGQLMCDDGAIATAPVDGAAAVGPTVVVMEPASGNVTAYRDGRVAVALVVPGTLSSVARAVDEALAIRYGFALAAIVLSSTPLAVAAVKGFVF